MYSLFAVTQILAGKTGYEMYFESATKGKTSEAIKAAIDEAGYEVVKIEKA
ncbi:MAG: heavy metal transport/detoxification protein [Clostridiaceae bacterium]|nr:heavy metal transport/detoxification protein [Clostridiaceae bacterium]